MSFHPISSIKTIIWTELSSRSNGYRLNRIKTCWMHTKTKLRKQPNIPKSYTTKRLHKSSPNSQKPLRIKTGTWWMKKIWNYWRKNQVKQVKNFPQQLSLLKKAYRNQRNTLVQNHSIFQNRSGGYREKFMRRWRIRWMWRQTAL